MSLEALFRDLADKKDNGPRMSRIGQVARLREFGELYSGENPFKVGDLVTPRKGGNIKDAGEPHLVVEIRSDPIWHFSGDVGSERIGKRLNIRVAQIHSDVGAVCFWGEHHAYEPYTEDGSRAGDLDPA